MTQILAGQMEVQRWKTKMQVTFMKFSLFPQLNNFSYKRERTDYLSASIADPSSNNSSTIFIAESFFDSLLAESRDLFLKERRSLSLFRF